MLAKEEQKMLFLDLVNVSYRGLIDKHNLLDKYPDTKSAVASLIALRQRVMKKPEMYGITKEECEMVRKALDIRSKTKTLTELTQSSSSTIPSSLSSASAIVPLGQNLQSITAIKELEQMEVKELVSRGTKKAFILLNKKIDQIVRSRKAVAKTPLNIIASAAGVLFDRNQISKGEVTQRISILARISKEMTPKQKMEWVLRLREKLAQQD